MSSIRFLSLAAVAPLLLAQAPATYPGSKEWADIPTIGAGVAAQLGCAGVFVAGRPAADVERDDVHGMNPLLGGAKITVDDARKTVTAVALPRTPARTSYWRPGVGCTLAFGAAPSSAAPAQPGVPERTFGRRPGAWPRGDAPLAAAAGGKLDAAVGAVFDELNAKGPDTRAVLVVQDGRLVAERYAPGFDARTRLLGWSMSKTVTGALVGALVADGKLKLDAPAPVPARRSATDGRERITLRQLLQFTDGLAFTDAVVPGDESTMLFGRPDMAAYTAERPMAHAPGEVWNYSTGSTVVLAKIARDALGGSEAATQRYLRKRVFDPAGMESAVLQDDATGTPVGGSYVYATARDWARFGLAWLNDGVGARGRMLPKSWITFSTTPNGRASLNRYGAQVWLNAGDAADPAKRQMPHLPRDAYFFLGHNQQVVAVIPSRRAVIVRMGWTPDGQRFDADGYFARILAALPRG